MNIKNIFPYNMVAKTENRYNYKYCPGCHSEYIFSQPPLARLYCRFGNMIVNFYDYHLTDEASKREIDFCLENASSVIYYVDYGSFKHCPYCNYEFKKEDEGYVENGEEKEVWYLVFSEKLHA